MKWWMFVIMAALSWGAYVPTIQHGQIAFGGPNRAMRAFLFIGLAYFLMAVIVPTCWLMTHKNPLDPGFKSSGMTLSTLAGIFGAVGALGVVFAHIFGGPSAAVSSLIFAGAPIVSVFVSLIWDSMSGISLKNAINPFFFVGILLAAAGAAMVLYFRPT